MCGCGLSHIRISKKSHTNTKRVKEVIGPEQIDQMSKHEWLM